MQDNPYVKSLAQKVLEAIIHSDEVLDVALETYIDKHPELAEATGEGQYTSDYHDIFEQAIDAVINQVLVLRSPDVFPTGQPVTEAIAAFADKHCGQQRDVFMEDLRVLAITIEKHFRDCQKRGEFTDGTGDKFLATCETHKIEPWKEA